MSQESQAKRLNKYISETGFCSRREADKLIGAGRVTINGKIPEMGTKVLPGDDVEIDSKPVRSKEKPSINRQALPVQLNVIFQATSSTSLDTTSVSSL